jgi:hypothetical protein
MIRGSRVCLSHRLIPVAALAQISSAPAFTADTDNGGSITRDHARVNLRLHIRISSPRRGSLESVTISRSDVGSLRRSVRAKLAPDGRSIAC